MSAPRVTCQYTGNNVPSSVTDMPSATSVSSSVNPDLDPMLVSISKALDLGSGKAFAKGRQRGRRREEAEKRTAVSCQEGRCCRKCAAGPRPESH